MSTGHRLRRIRRTRQALSTLIDHLAAAERQWADLEPGMRAQSFTPPAALTHHVKDDDDDDQWRPTVADPTGNAATTPSAARTAELDLDDTLERLERAAQHAADVVTRWAVERPLKAAELAELERQGEPGCEIVGRIARPKGPAHWEPVHRTTDLGGLLDRPYRLGLWAYKFTRTNGRLPSIDETTAHVEGRRVRVGA